MDQLLEDILGDDPGTIPCRGRALLLAPVPARRPLLACLAAGSENSPPAGNPHSPELRKQLEDALQQAEVAELQEQLAAPIAGLVQREVLAAKQTEADKMCEDLMQRTAHMEDIQAETKARLERVDGMLNRVAETKAEYQKVMQKFKRKIAKMESAQQALQSKQAAAQRARAAAESAKGAWEREIAGISWFAGLPLLPWPTVIAVLAALLFISSLLLLRHRAVLALGLAAIQLCLCAGLGDSTPRLVQRAAQGLAHGRLRGCSAAPLDGHTAPCSTTGACAAAAAQLEA
ncbi:ABC transporter permease [Chlorella sorokiniana]|uniref:ABC transporter permease n=1 Tax=Chlorella sorokiniana TaxID=3076 RepID=A0A2P6U0K8_CHLSO|nr:ABC transporter permease [Chlorella sorokiniana]|eukprot:PRW59846.1 ABC transporter permease [Chlorella sorokiniana]